MGHIPQFRLLCSLLAPLLLAFLPGAALAAQAPVIDSLTPSSFTVLPGGVVTVTVDAHDPDCATSCTSGCGEYIRADLTAWSATGGTFLAEDDGVSGSPYTASADWEAPDTEGTYTISVSLSDSGSFICGGRQSASDSVDILVTVSTNEPPLVESVTAVPAQVFPGGTSNLSCVASDPDGDPITYSWDTDSGTVDPGLDGSAVFTAGAPGIATVTCTATDDSAASGSDTVQISVVGALAEKSVGGVVTPQKLAIDSMGDVYVVDGAAAGISVVNLFSGEAVYRIPLPGVRAVAVDWADNLLVGGTDGARVLDRRGEPLLTLRGGPADVIAVAADAVNRRYGVLHRRSGRVEIYDELGALVNAFGSTGDGADQFKSPHGLAATNAGGHWAAAHWVVADSGHGKVKIFDDTGTLVTAFGDTGGGAGEFIQLGDVAVADNDVIYASDGYQSWIQSFNPDGTLRETLGTYGDETGQFKTATGVTVAEGFDRLVAASLNAGRLEVFATSSAPVTVGPAPSPDFDAASLVFGEQLAGTSSASQDLVLTNTGDAPLGIDGVVVQGDFAQTSDCGSFLDPGQACTFAVVFEPQGPGPHTGALVIDTSAQPARLAASLSGSAFVLPVISLTPATLVFPEQVVGTVSLPQDVTLDNHGPGPVAIADISVTPPYLASDDCGASVPEAGSCTIVVSFAPQATGDQIPGSLSVISDALDSPHTVALLGSSVDETIHVSIADAARKEGDDGAADLVFDVTLTLPSDGTISVGYSTRADTAEAGVDYETVSGTVVFPDGATRAAVAVPVLGDTLLEPDEETFFIDLADPVGAELADAEALGTIEDDEFCAGPNLLLNPGAEEPADGQGIPGWTDVLGVWTRRSAPPEPLEGEAFLSPGTDPGNTLETAELEQVVDLSAFDAAILSGNQWFEFGGYLRAADEWPSDTARVVVEYLHYATGAVLDFFDSGEIESPLAWQLITDLRRAPSDTGWIRVRLIGERYSPMNVDSYFDGLWLRSVRAPTLVIDDVEEYEGDPGTTHDSVFTVTLACPYYQDVSVEFTTVDGTAVAGEDYAFNIGTASIPSGETASPIPVTVFGDSDDEGHETFYVELSGASPDEAVLVDPLGRSRVTNDDFCPQKPIFWKKHSWLWPVTQMEIGGVHYDQSALMELLDYGGADAASMLARELVATKLNLAKGSPPVILPVVEQADAFLTIHPPGSDPVDENRDQAIALTDQLAVYNNRKCK